MAWSNSKASLPDLSKFSPGLLTAAARLIRQYSGDNSPRRHKGETRGNCRNIAVVGPPKTKILGEDWESDNARQVVCLIGRRWLSDPTVIVSARSSLSTAKMRELHFEEACHRRTFTLFLSACFILSGRLRLCSLVGKWYRVMQSRFILLPFGDPECRSARQSSSLC